MKTRSGGLPRGPAESGTDRIHGRQRISMLSGSRIGPLFGCGLATMAPTSVAPFKSDLERADSPSTWLWILMKLSALTSHPG